MVQNCPIHAIDPTLLPTSAQALFHYRQCGGQITESSNFGSDPLVLLPDKHLFRERAFKQQFPSFNIIYHQLISDHDKMFQDGLKYFIDLTFRLSH